MKSILAGLFLMAMLGVATNVSAHPVCGDGICQTSESNAGCPDDCYCGDGLCKSGESTSSCSDDCYCGNRKCDPGEDGTSGSCPQECCDYNTSCTQTQFNEGVNYCRRWSLNNGSTWSGWGWQSIASYNAQYCSQSSQICAVEANCHNTYSICVHTTPPTGRFEILPTSSCP